MTWLILARLFINNLQRRHFLCYVMNAINMKLVFIVTEITSQGQIEHHLCEFCATKLGLLAEKQKCILYK